MNEPNEQANDLATAAVLSKPHKDYEPPWYLLLLDVVLLLALFVTLVYGIYSWVR